MSRIFGKLACLLISVVALTHALAPSAYAEKNLSRPERARNLFFQAVNATEKGHWNEALALFRKSQSLVDRPNTTFNIGRALLELGRPEEARGAFQRYLRISDRVRDRELRSEAESKLQVLQARSPPSKRVEMPTLSDLPPSPKPTSAPLSLAPAPIAEAPTNPGSDSFWSSPMVWVVGAVVVVGSGVALGLLLTGRDSAPYAGNTGVVLRGLNHRNPQKRPYLRPSRLNLHP